MEGRVRLREVELIARVPSQARAEIDSLARQEVPAVRVNWSGDPEIVAWGVSMGAALEYRDLFQRGTRGAEGAG
ncbi:hypothetical protein SMICM304S_03712 [Streptomyces microflavus]